LPGHQQLARHDTVVLPHPPYPPSLELCIEWIVLLDFIHRLVSQEQTKLRN
jgi:hypothetical protein